MNLAIMQPYLFPYIGYFQLIYSVDLFLIYDDVTFIKQSFINRNRLLSPSGPTRFTVPVPGASSNRLISELAFSTGVEKVLKMIEQNYSKAPNFSAVFPMIRDILEHEDRSIASICQEGYRAIFSYLGIEKQFKKTSELEYDRAASAQDRLISLCHKFKADCYINTAGGRALYTKSDFIEEGVDLKFIQSLPVEYSQSRNEFVPNLSIIDVLMNCTSHEVLTLMKQYDLN